MSRPHFHHKFRLQTTNGDATDFFGSLSNPDDPGNPVLTIKVKSDDSVEFSIDGKPGSEFENHARGRYVGSTDPCWPKECVESDLIVGDIYGDQPDKRQLFVMWVRVHPCPKDADRYLTLGFYIFKHDCRLSSCSGNLLGTGVGQDAGGGTGSGPH